MEGSFFTDQDGGEGWFGDELSTVGFYCISNSTADLTGGGAHTVTQVMGSRYKAVLSYSPLISCCAAQLLTGHGWYSGVGNPRLKDLLERYCIYLAELGVGGGTG